MKSIIYLDHAAATPVDPQVLRAMEPYFSQQFYNPSAGYLAAQAVHKDVEAARAKMAHWFGARPTEIIFTAGGTEANNLAIHGIMANFPNANIVVSSIEHESVLAPAGQYDCREAKVKPDGTIDLMELEKLIDDQTVLVSVMYANNEIGTIQPIRDIAKLISAIKQQRTTGGNNRPLFFHSDAAQAAAYLDLHAARLGVDMMTVNGGKIYGPKQSGVLYVRAGLPLRPLIVGGGQERNMRSGTENVAGNIGLAAALDLVQNRRHEEVRRLQNLSKQFIEQVKTVIPKAVINGSLKSRLPNNIHLTLPGEDNERLLILLDEAGILAAAGSACSASSDDPSHVLRAIGLSDAEAQSSLRFTMGRSTIEADISRTVQALASFVS
jgi:cysteine desulfurase